MKKSKLKNKIRETMPYNFDELEIAAFIMKEIAKNRSFSEKYYWSDKKTRNKIYSKSIHSKKTQDKQQLTCIIASRLFKEIAEKDFGLDVYYIGDSGRMTKNDLTIFEKGEHVSPVVKLKDGRFIKADIQWDLENIQTGSKWLGFGSKQVYETQLSGLSEDELDNIMKKIGYINNPNEYTDIYCKQLFKNSINLSTAEKLEKLFNDDFITSKVSNFTSSVEIYKFYRRLISQATKHSEDKLSTSEYNKSVFLFANNIKSKNDRTKKYSICTVLFEDQTPPAIWMYSKKNKRMIPVSLEEMKYFMDNNKMKIIPAKNDVAYHELLEKLSTTPALKSDNNIHEMVL